MGKGCIGSLDGNVYPSSRRDSSFALCLGASNFELYAHLVRLKLGIPIWGGRRSILAPRLHRRRLKVPSGQVFDQGETAMRSDLVFGALSHVSNRYQLCQLASKATRKLHKPNTRLQDTANEVFARFHTTNPGTVQPVEAPAAQPVERRRAA
jgi:hypothetical protein